MPETVPGKGTAIQLSIASVYTTIGQVLDIDKSDDKNETYEITHLNSVGAGKKKMPTGYTEVGDMSFNMFYDPQDAAHKEIISILSTPAIRDWKLIYNDTANSEMAFQSAGVAFGSSVAMSEGLKAGVTLELADLPVYPA